MKLKTGFAVVVTLLIVASLLPACGTTAVVPTPGAETAAPPPPTAAPGEKPTLTMITLTGPRYQFAAECMAKEYMRLNPNVTIKVESFPHEEYVNRMAMEVAGKGTTYDLPWIDYKFIGGWADAGYLLPIDQYLEANAAWWSDLQSDVYPTVLNMYNYKDTWWALPNDGNTELFYYRKDLLEQAGVALPKTWDELLQVAPKLNNPPNQYAVGGNFARFWATDFWLSIFYSLGKQVWDDNYVPQMDTPEAVQAAELFMKIAEFAPKEALTWEEADVYEAMGSAGIIAMAPAQWGGAVLTNPELASLSDKIGVGLVPSIDPEGNQRVLPMGGFGIGINAQTKYPDAAFAFLKWWLSKENQQFLVACTGQPARVSALTDPVNLKIAPYLEAEAQNLKFAKPRPVIAEYASAEQIIGIELNEMLLGNKTAEQAMKDANEQVRKVLIESGKLKP